MSTAFPGLTLSGAWHAPVLSLISFAVALQVTAAHAREPASAPTARTGGLESKPVRDARLPSTPVGTLSPETGKWNSFVTVRGPGFGKAERVRVIWYPNDDATQTQAGSMSATVRKRVGADEFEMEMPRDAGGANGGVVRVLVFMPGQLQPKFAGRFTVDNRAATVQAPAAPAAAPGRAFRDAPVDDSKIKAPGPVMGAVTPVSMFAIKVEWQQATGASIYVIHALEQGQTVPAKSRELPAAAGGAAMSGEIAALTPGFPHEVWVEARYPDRRVGRSEIKRAITQSPVNPKDLTATLLAPGAVQLKWTPIDGAEQYLAEGSRLQRLQTQDPIVTIANLPAGRHEWRVFATYGKGVYNDLQPAVASITLDATGNIASDKPASTDEGRGRYRVTLNGFRVDRATVDDALQRDGKGDEVFVSVQVEVFDRVKREPLQKAIVKSPVFGDKNGFPGSGRVLAGTMSTSGGLRGGDTYPHANPAGRLQQPTTIDLPLLVWEGELVSGSNAVLIAPSIWEWDDKPAFYNGYVDRFHDDRLSHFGTGRIAHDAVTSRFMASQLSVLKIVGLSAFLATFVHAEPMPGYVAVDRPIGLDHVPAGRGSGTLFRHDHHLLVLTREAVENELKRSSQIGGVPPGTIAIHYRDDPGHAGALSGDYTLYVQVERVP